MGVAERLKTLMEDIYQMKNKFRDARKKVVYISFNKDIEHFHGGLSILDSLTDRIYNQRNSQSYNHRIMSKIESTLSKIADDLEEFTMEAENAETVTIAINQHPSILPRRAFSYIIIVGKIMYSPFSNSVFNMYLALRVFIPTYETQILMAVAGYEFKMLTGAEFYQEICNLLKKDKDLLQEFRQFTSEEGTSFDILINKLKKAINFLDVYRASYPNDNEAIKKFVDILIEFQSEM
ncbi:hypothetical protein CHUAL_005308 [Chamberlinius hualienensis]